MSKIIGNRLSKFLLFLLISSLLVASCFVSGSNVQGQSQDTYSIQLQGFVWNHSILHALVVTSDNESWWNPNFVNITLRAIGQWNDAITAFASNNSDFNYLSNLKILYTVSNESRLGFDLYIHWSNMPLSNTTDEVGLSQIFANYQSTIVNSTIDLSVHAHHGDLLTEGDMQNIALHELGHSLGLGHSNYTGDLMYAFYTRGSPGEDISTLDVYGVATLFAWENRTSSFYPIHNWLKNSSVTLPSDQITYEGLPVSAKNAPPQTFGANPVVQFLIFMFEILIHPEIFTMVLVFFVVFVIVALIPKKKKVAKTV